VKGAQISCRLHGAAGVRREAATLSLSRAFPTCRRSGSTVCVTWTGLAKTLLVIAEGTAGDIAAPRYAATYRSPSSIDPLRVFSLH